MSKSKNTIAILEINGIISASIQKTSMLPKEFDLMAMLDFLSRLEDEKRPLRGILLRLNTPGGTAGASEELAIAIQRVKEKREVPVVASIADACCSGGYMVAVVADKIYANRQSLTGSIGTILSVLNYQELAGKIGIRSYTVKSGKMKDIGNPFREMTADEQTFLEDIARQGHKLFSDFVLAHRPGISQADVMMDGRPVDAVTALENGLIDAFGTYLDAYDELLKLSGILKREDAKELRMKQKRGILHRLLGTVFLPSPFRFLQDLASVSNIQSM